MESGDDIDLEFDEQRILGKALCNVCVLVGKGMDYRGAMLKDKAYT